MKQTILFLFVVSVNAMAQQRTISGYVQEAETLEPLTGVSVYDSGLKKGNNHQSVWFF